MCGVGIPLTSDMQDPSHISTPSPSWVSACREEGRDEEHPVLASLLVLLSPSVIYTYPYNLSLLFIAFKADHGRVIAFWQWFLNCEKYLPREPWKTVRGDVASS